MTWTDRLRTIEARAEAVAWAEPYLTAEEAWAACDRGDWMLWWAGREAGAPWSEARRPLVLAACACARLALPHVPAGEARPLRAIETAESWARGEGATPEDMRAAVATVWASTADASVAGARAWASAAWAAAPDSDEATLRPCVDTLRECADLVRRFYPHPPTQA